MKQKKTGVRVNYGLNRVVRGKRGARRIEHTQGSLTSPADNHADIMDEIRRVKPEGWSITGYAIIQHEA